MVMNDADSAQIRGKSTPLWARLGDDVKKAVARVTDQRQVVGLDPTGRVVVASTDPERDEPTNLPRIRGSVVQAGDTVLTLKIGTREIVLGALAGETDPEPTTTDLEASVEGTGGNPGADVFDVIAVICKTIKYAGATVTMTAKELALAQRMVGQFPGLAQIASGGKIGVRTRVVVRDELWDIDAAIAAGSAVVTTFNTGPGKFLTEAGASFLWDTYHGMSYDCRFLFLGTGQMNSTVNEVTRQGTSYSFMNVEDAWYDADKAANQLTDAMLRAFIRQLEERVRDAGGRYLLVRDPGTFGYTQHVNRNYLDWLKYWFQQADLSGVDDDGGLPEIHPRTASVALNYVNPDDSWGNIAPTPVTNSTPSNGGGGGGGTDHAAATVADTTSVDMSIVGQLISAVVRFAGSGTADTVARSDHKTVATDITSGVVPTARLGSGTASATTFLAGDQTWKTITTGGSGATTLDDLTDVQNTAAGTTGQVLTKQASGQWQPATLPSGSTPVTGSDTASVDVTVTGQNITADVIFAGSGTASTAARSDHKTNGGDITSGLVPPARLGTGTPNSSNVLYGDGAWRAAPTGGGGGGDYNTSLDIFNADGVLMSNPDGIQFRNGLSVTRLGNGVIVENTAQGGGGGGGIAGARRTWSVLIVVPRVVRYQGTTRTMTTKEWNFSVKVTEQFAALMEICAGHILDFHVHAVFRTAVWDLDADIAAGSQPPEPYGSGSYFDQPCAVRLLNSYGGDNYDSQVLFQSRSGFPCPADGLTRGWRSSPGLSTILVGDGTYDSYYNNNRLADVIVHEMDHQFEYRFQQEGIPNNQVSVDELQVGLGVAGQPGGAPNHTVLNWFSNYCQWWDYVTDFILRPGIDISFRPNVPTRPTGAVYIMNRVVLLHNSWNS